MLDPDNLNVWNNEWLVGYLWRNSQGWVGFRYDSEWINQKGFAISQTLPLQSGPFEPDDRTAHHFFANLLPEGTVREQIVRDLKIPDTIFDLLRAIGGECAGALSILEVEHQPSTESSYREITDDELARLVARRGRGYIGNSENRSRLSLAGAQNKCPILFQDETYWLPIKESTSTHILKFELSDYRNIPAYETFTTWLAEAVGLPVVNIQLRSVVNTRFVLIKRYDRNRFREGRVERLHQEDLCQAMGFSHVRKYESDGGPGFADCCRLIRRVSTDPANDLLICFDGRCSMSWQEILMAMRRIFHSYIGLTVRCDWHHSMTLSVLVP